MGSHKSGVDPGGGAIAPLKPKNVTSFTIILYNSEKNIRVMRLFCRPLFCHSNRPVTRGRGAATPRKFFAPLEKCVEHRLELLDIVQKSWASPGVPSWLRAYTAVLWSILHLSCSSEAVM